MQTLRSPLHARLVQWLIAPGAAVRSGDVIVILEAMKMEHEIRASADMRVTELFFAAGEMVQEGEPLCASEPAARTSWVAQPEKPPSTEPAKALLASEQTLQARGMAQAVRADLQGLVARTAFTLDVARPEAVAKRHALGLRTARENLADLCDAGSFVEYGALAVAAQRTRRSEEDLIQNTPADGMVTGIGSVNGQQVVAMAYDATVLAGTQGMRNHQKTDRMLGLALQNQLPVVLFAEGGGGRPGDVDMPVVAGLHVSTFASFARLNGQVPVMGVAAGRCFAGNAALLGCCDVIIATQGSNIGMGAARPWWKAAAWGFSSPSRSARPACSTPTA